MLFFLFGLASIGGHACVLHPSLSSLSSVAAPNRARPRAAHRAPLSGGGERPEARRSPRCPYHAHPTRGPEPEPPPATRTAAPPSADDPPPLASPGDTVGGAGARAARLPAPEPHSTRAAGAAAASAPQPPPPSSPAGTAPPPQPPPPEQARQAAFAARLRAICNRGNRVGHHMGVCMSKHCLSPILGANAPILVLPHPDDAIELKLLSGEADLPAMAVATACRDGAGSRAAAAGSRWGAAGRRQEAARDGLFLLGACWAAALSCTFLRLFFLRRREW